MRLSASLLPLLLVATVTLAGPVAKDQLTTSDTCGSCHRDIYRMWAKSAHATAMENTVFLESYREAGSSLGAAGTRACLLCHAPMVAVNEDWALEQKITWEGVSCDLCHSMTAVDLSGLGPRMSLDVGMVKRGPIPDAESTGHDVAFSRLHEDALVCAPCHEFQNEEGTHIMTTFSEYQASKSAESGATCQTCHMGATKANVVDPRVKRVEHAQVNLHEVPGGRSLSQLNKALRVAHEQTRVGDELVVEVRLVNRGAGHAVPTGMPGRRVILAVEVEGSDGDSFEDRRVYEKVFANASGERVDRVYDFFARGVRLESDTRIAADETRTETFRFPLSAASTAFVTVSLHYEHVPLDVEQGGTRLTFFTERRTLLPEGEGT
jgi:hypothetical protein